MTSVPSIHDSAFPTNLSALVQELDAEVISKQFTAWAFANSRYCVSSFFADECTPPLEGNCDWQNSLHPVFDLASLTKPLFTNLFLRLLDPNCEHIFQLPLREIFATPKSESAEIFKTALQNSNLRLYDVCNHRSGVPPWMWFGKGFWHFASDAQSAGVLADGVNPQKLQAKFEQTLTTFAVHKLANEACAETYSDIGYFLMARILENLPQCQNNTWAQRLDLINTTLGTQFTHASINPNHCSRALPAFPYTNIQNQIVPQGAFQKREFGCVHDTNANMLARVGVVSGHAGLFGTILDVISAIPTLAASQHRLTSSLRNANAPRFAFGLDTPTSEQSAAGPLQWPLPSNSRIYGHLGYTGTMFWFNQNVSGELKDISVLLTNRTAHRTILGSEIAPRVVVCSVLPRDITPENMLLANTSHTHYFVQTKPGCELKAISRNHAEEICVAHARANTRVWNDACLRSIPNIQTLRKLVSQKLWNMNN